MSQLSPNVTPDLGGTFFKVDVIKGAYSKIRISGLTVNPTPQDLELALTRYENMMAEWEAKNIALGYNYEDNPDPNSKNNVKKSFQDAMENCLAVRIIPDFNKAVPPILYEQANASYSFVSGRAAIERLQGVPYPRRQARGSGNTLKYNRWSRFYREYVAGSNQPAKETMFIGDTDDFTAHFEAYLGKSEIISSYDIVADPAFTLVSDSNDDTNVFYRLTAGQPTSDNSTLAQIVTIIITTDTGRVQTRQILFQLTPRDKDI